MGGDQFSTGINNSGSCYS